MNEYRSAFKADFFHTACKIVEKTKEAVDFTAEYRRDKLWGTGT